MNDPTIAAVREGVRRALYEWQLEHREPCDQCEWETEDLYMLGHTLPARKITTLHACGKHGGQP